MDVNSEPARKRQRLQETSPQTSSTTTTTSMSTPAMENDTSKATLIATASSIQETMSQQAKKEAAAGITRYVNEVDPGFSGILKQRYTDFLVNEITPDGKVVHLTDIKAPRVEKAKQVWDRTNEATSGPVETSPVAKTETLVTDGNSVNVKVEATTGLSAPAGSVDTTEGQKATPSQPLSNGQEPKPPVDELSISDEDAALLDSYFGAETRRLMVRLYAKISQNPTAKPFTFGNLFTVPMHDRGLRGQMHQNVRRIFKSSFETSVDEDNVIKISCAPRQNAQPRGQGKGRAPHVNGQKGKLGWNELGGEHLHFSLYKENKDTMEVVSFLGSKTRIPSKNFAFAGTKDRRAVTVQRVSVYRTRAEDLVRMNKDLRNSLIGDFEYRPHRLELGELAGNEFVITLRECEFGDDTKSTLEQKLETAKKVVGSAIKSMQEHGFINYFGLQRFGSFNVGTDVVGKKILQGDFEGAVRAILHYESEAFEAGVHRDGPYNPSNLPRDDIARAQAIHGWEENGRVNQALEILPRKFSGETSIIRQLGKAKQDFVGALLSINRNLRMMYVHAYQSLIWNVVASRRWAQFGSKVIAGDLVLVSRKDVHQDVPKEQEQEVDENGEIIVRPAADDFAKSIDDIFERARPLTEGEAESGQYTIFDIVLPLPGFDVEYPSNEIGDYYKEFMASEEGGGLDPANMRRSNKDFSLSGSYRKLLSSIDRDASFEVRTYNDDNEQMVETDLEKIRKVNPSLINVENHRVGPHNQGHGREGQNRNQQQNGRGGRGGRGPGRGGRGGILDSHQSHPSEEATQKEVEAAATRAASQAAWANAPLQIAADEKAEAAKYAERKAMEEANPTAKPAPAQPTFHETFIETEAEEGRRTGRREKTIAHGTVHVKNDSISTVDNDEGGGALLDVAPSQGIKRALETEMLESNKAIKLEQDDSAERLDEPKAVDILNEDVKLAVIIKFQLGTSQYATMALRELMKVGNVKTYKPDFSAGR